VLIAPAVAPIFYALLILYEERSASSLPVVIAVLLFSYTFSLVPAALVLVTLKKLGWLKLWQFTAAGLVMAIICTSAFVLYAHTYARSSFDGFRQEFFELRHLLIVGPIAGALVWFISEARNPWSRRRILN
jgi:uncharacterized membrane protein YagU involved in acid resistance